MQAFMPLSFYAHQAENYQPHTNQPKGANQPNQAS